MATSDIAKSGANPDSTPSSKDGYTLNYGTYEAEVVGHVENSRSGQLEVVIPSLGGLVSATDVGRDAGKLTVSYASPFFGLTAAANTGLESSDPSLAPQSYGMWFVPPDIGNTVLVTFVNGKRDKGYWFACPVATPGHHMVPGNARHIAGNDKTPNYGNSPIAQYRNTTSILPVAEVSISSPDALAPDGLQNALRPPHLFQSMTLIAQGLDADPIRGAISSSSLREAPSNVYGISTPGRKITPGDQSPVDSQIVFLRKGGHTFVMDDGDKDGNDQLIRLRTSGGHQVLMNDKEKILYIASNTGNQWMEFSANGSINVYGAAGINMRSKGPMNFHSDSAIKMNAMNIEICGSMGIKIDSLLNVSIGALGTASLKAGGALSLTGLGIVNLQAGAMLKVGAIGAIYIDGATIGLNCGSIPTPLPPIPSIPKAHPEASFTGTNWNANGAAALSVCTVVPGHEPWVRPAPKT